MARLRTAILVSGRGSNMAALLAAAQVADYPAEIVLVLSSRPDAPALAKAESAGATAASVDHKRYANRPEFEAALNHRLAEAAVEFICLAGFMRLFSPGFVGRWRDRMINIHPSLLPAFPGLDTHRRALAAGVRFSGCTVHFVREATDTGPIVGQAVVPIVDGDTPETLAARVLAAEHRLYPLALRLIGEGKVSLEGDRARILAPTGPGTVLFSPSPA